MENFLTSENVQYFLDIKQKHQQSIIDFKVIQKQTQEVELQANTLRTRKATLETKLERHNIAATYIQSVIDTVCDTNLRKIEHWVNTGLKDIFYDQEIVFKITKDIKYNKNVYSFLILNDGVEGTKESYGGGILCVIALILKVIFLNITQSKNILVLDESLSFLSKQYIENCALFIKMLTQEFKITVVLVTHQDEFLSYADTKWTAEKKNGSTVFSEYENT